MEHTYFLLNLSVVSDMKESSGKAAVFAHNSVSLQAAQQGGQGGHAGGGGCTFL